MIDSTSYSYTRNIDNVTFTAVDGAVFTKTFLSDGVEVNSDMSWFTPFASETYDAVKQKTLSESATYKKNMHLNNVEIRKRIADFSYFICF